MGWSVELFDLRIRFVLINLRGRPMVYLFADGGYAFGRDRVESVVRYALIADVRADCNLRVRHRLSALREFCFKLDGVVIGVKSQLFYRLKPTRRVCQHQLDGLLLAGVQTQLRV